MRAVIQRVANAEVAVDAERIGSIGPGLLALVGAEVGDTERDAEVLAAKILGLRVFADADGKMNLDVADIGGEVLVVSQFTLVADIRRGRRPSFGRAAPPEAAAPLVVHVADTIAESGVPVSTGRFGAAMAVRLVNDGPVTILVEVTGGKVR